MADSALLVDALVPILQDFRSTRYSELASSTIIAYDYLLTLNQEASIEIEYIWRAKWTIGKVLFFINRYYTLFVVIFNNYALFSPALTDSVRLVWFRWQGWTGLVACAIAETILQLRLYALYYGNKKILALMVGFFIAAMAASATIMGSVLHGVDASANLIPTTKLCVPLSSLNNFYAFWIPILCFETLLCALACVRGYKSYRDHEIHLLRKKRNTGQYNDANQRTEEQTASDDLNILEILLRDSVGYFVVIFATYFTTVMIWILGPITVLEIPVGFTVALSSVIGNRLLLNLRGRGESGNANDASFFSSLSTIEMRHTLPEGTAVIEDDRHEEGFTSYEMRALRKLKASA
ncbi:hypothetical protein M0805_008399 [Coniferiporia weirii]|nr:hypothetical protein M0805_008399 [Coniferiporia weirii]